MFTEKVCITSALQIVYKSSGVVTSNNRLRCHMRNLSILGSVGELEVCTYLNLIQKEMLLKYIHNMPIAIPSGYSQVDCIAINKKGIFVIEIKSWQCRVYCNRDEYWICEYPNKTLEVPNPLRQNRMHCKVISNILNLPVRNLVVYSQAAELNNNPDNVINIGQLSAYINTGEDIYGEEFIVNCLKSLEEHKKAIICDMMVSQIFRRYNI